MQQEQTFIEKQAYDWLVKIETGSMAIGDEDRFVEWLSQDEKHGEAFYQAETAWKLMHKVKEQDINPADLVQQEEPSSFVRRFMAIAAGVLVAFSTFFWGQTALDATFSDYYTATGTKQAITLDDGTVVTLNTDSALDIQFSQDSRVVVLKRGEIYVDVAPDTARPFIVDAGALKVTALGTEFMVNKHDKSKPSVTVTEHSVKVENLDNLAESLVLKTGQKATLLSERNVISLTEKVNTAQEIGWLSGKYVFTNKSVEHVVDELSRYYQGKIIIRDDEIKNLTVSGVLNLEQPLTSLQGLSDILPIKVRSITPYLIIIEQV